MSSHNKILPIVLNTPPQKNPDAFSHGKSKAADDVEGVAKCLKFSYDVEDASGIGQPRYEMLMLAIKRQQIRLKWHEETLREQKKQAKFYLGTVKKMKLKVKLAKQDAFRKFCASKEAVQMREAEARKGFDLFREYARGVVPEYNWDAITMQ